MVTMYVKFLHSIATSSVNSKTGVTNQRYGVPT